jgi:uncharacterized OB-fold protein
VTESWRPLPQITNDSEAFWQSTHKHQMKLQRCSRCGKFRFYPSEACHFCASLEYEWIPVSGRGKIHTYTVLERARGTPYEHNTPITIVLVELDEGPIVMSNLVDFDDEDLEIDTPVTMDYEDVTDTVTVFVFRPDRSGA